jgi:hypothetical protein
LHHFAKTMSANRRLSILTGQIAASNGAAPMLSASPTAAKKKPMKVVVTGAAGNIAYALLFMVGAGNMLGKDQPVELRLLDL